MSSAPVVTGMYCNLKNRCSLLIHLQLIISESLSRKQALHSQPCIVLPSICDILIFALHCLDFRASATTI